MPNWRSKAPRSAVCRALADVPSGERFTAAALILLAGALHVVAAFHQSFDSDETQHLHVVWAWTRGLLPYRDVFDNHPPLFAFVLAPLLRLFGEHAWSVFAMRLAMLPLGTLAALLTYLAGRILFSARVGLWAVVITAFFPTYFMKATEFRTDNLWAPLCLFGGLLLLAPLTWRRAAAAGATFGAALCVSQKTSFLLLAWAAAALVSVWFPRRREDLAPPRHGLLAVGLAFTLALLVCPTVVALAFAREHAFRALLDGVVLYNLENGAGLHAPWKSLLFVLGLVPLGLAVRHVHRVPGSPLQRERRSLFLLAAGLAYLGVVGLWPVVTTQDYLPILPLLAVFAAAAVLHAMDTALPDGSRAPWLAALALGELALLLVARPIYADRATATVAPIAEALQITSADQPVFDAKGELVFRPRATRLVLETLTRAELRRGDVPDRIPEDLAASGTCVAVGDSPTLPARTRLFLDEYFVRYGAVRVCGRDLFPERAGDAITFRVAIGARYVVVSGDVAARGTLDGKPAGRAVRLEPGLHTFVSLDGRPARLLWAQAVERLALPPSLPGGEPGG